MIYIGLTVADKISAIKEYCSNNEIDKIFILSPEKFQFECDNAEVIGHDDIIMYKYFYRLLEEINKKSLVIVNECMRTQNRNCLTYNCIRHYLNQTNHQLVFQYLPFIDDIQDFMILFDFDTRSKWKRERFDFKLIENCTIKMQPKKIILNPILIETDSKLRDAYQKEKLKLINNIGIKDPHTIPRNLYLMSGKARMKQISQEKHYIGRNNRFKIEMMQTYKEDSYQNNYDVFEFPHNFIDFADFLALSEQTELDVLVADLKVDAWYFERYTNWTRRLADGYTDLS